MAKSLAIILLLGLPANRFFENMRMPGLLGMLILGIIIGPYGLNWIRPEMINISSDLRKIALIIILLRAGFGINKNDLKKVGTSAIKMSFIPGVIEGFFIAFASIKIFDFSFIEGGILGFVLAAVSPAVVVPSMLDLNKNKIGTDKGIPTLIMAGASIDDVFAITIFSAFLGLYNGNNINIGIQLLGIPISILLGIIGGIIIGYMLLNIFNKYHIRDTKKVLLILGFSILFTELENLLKSKISIASLLGVMTIGFIILEKRPEVGKRLAIKFDKIWVFAQVFLFVLVGAQVNISVALDSGIKGIILILIGLIGRSIGVIISLLGTDLNWKERLFCIISYIPKATVQAAIGGVPLSLGVASGDVILAVAVLSILITAPLGAIGIRVFSESFLTVEK
ncbi:cation:proton antiporter [Anaerosalibacter bizertensis]|uniref:Cation:proton antiporter n=1 Tax=Anaerosalibacter bizertensis TaxID=932217 RepID=A0A9Q4FLR0_9FIRM|nr:cation:proton antiporter [Anaerosalibacter bizertensis]MBU5293785.1 cation:proton antiporter [Anaerosalibacter bizertensis]MCG4564864.1 cation:proton antiporter [Anaerosalibacter bizertensis]HHV27836.1 sodium:proton antiporter [Tissierellia bacterium]